MLRSQILRLHFTDCEVDERVPFTTRKLWKMLFGVALKARADEVWLLRQGEEVRLWCRINGQFQAMVPPPTSTTPSMIEELIDLARPRGFRAWIIQRLRTLIHRLEGPFGAEHSQFFLFTGKTGTIVKVEAAELESEKGVVLRFSENAELSAEADAIMRDYFTRQEEDRTPASSQLVDPSNEGLGGPSHTPK